MASSENETPTQTHLTAGFRWPIIRRGVTLRKRKMATVRLGGNSKPRRFFLLRMIRKMRLRWLRLQYSCMLRKLKKHYRSLIKDMAEARTVIDSYHQRLVLEASFAAPVGIAFSSYPLM